MSSKEKWHQMLIIVNQHSTQLQPNLARQLKKLFLQRLLTENLFVFILQYIGLNLSTLSLHSSPLWFATGTASAFLFLRGYSVLPGICLGTFFAYYFAKASFLVAFSCAIVFSLQALLLLWFSYYCLSPTLIFYRLSMFIKFIVYLTLLTGVSSFILVSICYSSLSHADAPIQLFLQWWLANFNAILIFSCALITFDAYFLDFYTAKHLKSTSLIFGLLLFFIIALILSHTPTSTTCMALLISLLTFFISAHFGWCGAITAAFLLGIVLSLAGLLEAGVFSTYSSSEALLLLQLFLCVNTIIGLGIAIRIPVRHTVANRDRS